MKGLYRGNTATMLREAPGNMAWFSTYHCVREVGLHPLLVCCFGLRCVASLETGWGGVVWRGMVPVHRHSALPPPCCHVVPARLGFL